MGPSYRVNVITASSLGNPAFASEATALFNNNQSGILTNAGGDFGAWEKLPSRLRSGLLPSAHASLANIPADWPEIEYLSINGHLGYQENPQADQPNDGYNYASVAIALQAPLSRGTIDISSANTADPPIINPQWLTHPTDQAVAVAAYKRVRELFATPAMRSIQIGPEYFPGANVSGSTPFRVCVVKLNSRLRWSDRHRCPDPGPYPQVSVHRLPRRRHLRHGPSFR